MAEFLMLIGQSLQVYGEPVLNQISCILYIGKSYTETYAKYQQAYLDANPHVKINDESATADETWKASIVTDFSAGNEPDVMFFFTDVTVAPIVDQNKVVSRSEERRVGYEC